MKTTGKMLKTRRQGMLLIAAALLFSAGGLSAAVTNISQLDAGCTFSFACFSDSRGEMDENTGRALGWIKNYHDFAIANGDLFDGDNTKDLAFQNLWRTNSYWNNNLYPTFGNHCSIINGGSQVNWGRPYYTLTNLNTSSWSFRAATTNKIWGFTSMTNHTLTPYNDQKIDYYVQRTFGSFKVHLVMTYKGDHTPYASMSATWMYNKVMDLAATKTKYDLVVVVGHEERWLTRACSATDGDFPGPMTTAQVEDVFENSDIVIGASDHQFRRMYNVDTWGLTYPALYIDSGQVYNTDATDGYLEFHVFDDTNPFVTAQYINADITTRILHVGRANGGAISIKSGHDENSQKPMKKVIDGAITQPLDWNTFVVPGAPPPATTYTSTFYSVAAHDGYVDEYSETSNTGGVIQATMTDGAAIRVGDTGAKKQRKGFLSFDCSPLPDACTITKATLRLKRGGGIGTPTSLSNLTVDVKNVNTGWSDNVALQAQDFQGPASASSVAALSYPATTNSWSTGDLNATGLTKITKTTASHTQYRVRFNADDDNDTADDYLGFYSGEAATGNKPELIVVYQ